MGALDDWHVAAEPYCAPQGDEVVLFEAAFAARLPVMVKGPTGCGKSRFFMYMAWMLGRRWTVIDRIEQLPRRLPNCFCR